MMFRSDSDDSQKFSMIERASPIFSLEFFHVVLLRTQLHSSLRHRFRTTSENDAEISKKRQENKKSSLSSQKKEIQF